MNISAIETDLRSYFSNLGIELPGEFPCPVPQKVGSQTLNRYFDHTLLKQAAAAPDYDRLFREALDWKPFSVCVPPNRIPAAVHALRGSEVKTCSVVGFPWGYDSTAAKEADTRWLVDQGCDEIDMVMAVGLLKDKDYLSVYRDIQAVVAAAQGRLVKVILETSELSEEEIAIASFLSGWAGSWFVKTSTGFASGGASVEAVRIMRAVAGDRLGVKASGGIRDRAFTDALIEAGADRIGASATGSILGFTSAGTSGY